MIVFGQIFLAPTGALIVMIVYGRNFTLDPRSNSIDFQF